MAAFGTVLSVAQTLFAALECPVLKEFCSMLGYKSELDNLKSTLSTVRAVLLDAEAKQHELELSHEARQWVEKLKDAVYDADDLLDKFTTLAEQKQLIKGGRVSKGVHVCFHHFNQLGASYTISRGIKKIRKKLDSISSDHGQFGFTLDCQSVRRRRQETCSYIYAEKVIGREHDTKVIVDMLLDNNVEGDVSFLTIVGIGGLGKTTLAQLVYNDTRVTNSFALRLWACVSDQDKERVDLKAILGKILESTTNEKHEDLGLDWLQRKLREKLEGKKYLIVLDDVWTEDRDEWLKLGDFLMRGGKGSRIMVTTRSKETARVIGNGPTYELQGLSKENSWQLFEIMAFEQVKREAIPLDLVEIGKNIVEKCAYVPLAIRVVGSLLYGQGKAKWLLFQTNKLAMIGKDGIIPVLKFSYHHLQSPLKSCFSYSALCPKGIFIKKERIISLWMAQGYIVPLDGRSIEDVGEEYFLTLLRRCFFQDVQRDEYGEVVTFKIHDLMHDLAEEVVEMEICGANSVTSSLDKRTRHLLIDRSNDSIECTAINYSTKSNIRTIMTICPALLGTFGQLPVHKVLANWSCLRALDLRHLGIKHLPGTICKLLHLRYLDLSGNKDLEMLPKSITKLYNLQTLRLVLCWSLKKLPTELSKMVKLRLLDIDGCFGLTCMPSGMDRLTSLHKLPMFVVSEGSSSSKHCVGQLEDIKALKYLHGHFNIRIPGNYTYTKGVHQKGRYLMCKERLISVNIQWGSSNKAWRVDDEEALLEDLQPHPNLKGLSLDGYGGTKIPSWARLDNLGILLPNLVTIRLQNCARLHYLPLLGKLRYLKSLRLENLQSLEYVENITYRAASASMSGEAGLAYFPSLEVLKLCELPQLKGWWRGLGLGDQQLIDSRSNRSSKQPCLLLSFPQLLKLTIRDCPELTCIPGCPTVERLCLHQFNGALPITFRWSFSYFSLFPDTKCATHPKLRKVEIDNVGYLKSLPMGRLTEMELCRNKQLERLSEVGDVFRSCSSSLRSLVIRKFTKLKSLSGALERLTALESLRIQDAYHSETSEEEDRDEPWRSLGHSLLSLEMWSLPKLVSLPKGLQHLTALQSLHISLCDDLKAIPTWIGCLSSLQSLKMGYCPKLKSLPEEICELTSLRQLNIWACPRLIVDASTIPHVSVVFG